MCSYVIFYTGEHWKYPKGRYFLPKGFLYWLITWGNTLGSARNPEYRYNTSYTWLLFWSVFVQIWCKWSNDHQVQHWQEIQEYLTVKLQLGMPHTHTNTRTWKGIPPRESWVRGEHWSCSTVSVVAWGFHTMFSKHKNIPFRYGEKLSEVEWWLCILLSGLSKISPEFSKPRAGLFRGSILSYWSYCSNRFAGYIILWCLLFVWLGFF